MAALLYGRGTLGEIDGRIVAAPRLPPPPSTEAKLLATISMQVTVCARDLGLPENMPRFLAAIHALRRLRWPIDQYTRAELGLHGMDDGALSGRWGIWPESRMWPRMAWKPDAFIRTHHGLPEVITWEANEWPGEPVVHGVGSKLPGCINPALAREFMDRGQFIDWRDQVMVAAMKGGGHG